MNKTSIEWVKNPDNKTQGYTWNPITGCLNGCPYCYARKLANGRLKVRYLHMPQSIYDNVGIAIQNDGKLPRDYIYEPDPFAPRLWGQRLEDKGIWQKIGGEAKPKGIFVCDMGELFGDWLPTQWQLEVFEVIKHCLQHRFYLLTKQPQNLSKFSPFPENCWVGVTATNDKQWTKAQIELLKVTAKIRFISFEPLLERMEIKPANLTFAGTPYIHWVIIGACTGTMKDLLPLHHKTGLPLIKWQGNRWILSPPMGAVEEIVKACDKAGIPVFLKDNLRPIASNIELFANPSAVYPYGILRQEMPIG